jgi:cell fate (sporulation/competence/biofilm development) regulator YlbF (YheA/YmcA/DUF963 family)
MQTATEENAIVSKTRELCETILNHPDYQGIRRRIDSFMANDEAKTQYEQLSERGEYLHHKQHQGVALTDQEIADFEKLRERFFSNPIAQGFADAQREMSKIQETVGQYVNKTFELGRVPETGDFESGSCGSGCGCHH